MIYLLYGNENFLIEQELKKIIKKTKIDNYNISKYNLLEESILNVIDDANTISLFEDKTVIIITNLIKSNIEEKELKKFENLIENISEEIVLIIIEEKLDERKKITKQLRKKAEVIELNRGKNISNTVKKMFEDYKIEYSTIDLLISIVGDDLSVIYQEVEKIKTYKEDKIITKQDVIDSASSNINNNMFDLINHIVKKEKEKSLELYKKLLKQNEEPIKIIITLANQFRLLYQVKELYKKGNREDTIAEILKVHPYRIKLALERSKNYSSKVLLDYLLKLAEMDKKIKTSKIDKTLALELFILEN